MDEAKPLLIDSKNLEEVKEYLISWAAKKGYVLSTADSKSNYLYLRCTRFGEYKPSLSKVPQERQREGSSKKCGCKYQLNLKRDINGYWIYSSGSNPIPHNHPPFESPLEHPSLLKLDEEAMKTVEFMATISATASETLQLLKLYFKGKEFDEDVIYNARKAIRKERLAGRAPVQALLDNLKDLSFYFQLQTNVNNEIIHLFFAHPDSIYLSRRFHNVFLMDATYKTNKFRMPLLHVVGQTCFNKSFTSCLVFMRAEKESDYAWALSCFRRMLGDDLHPR